MCVCVCVCVCVYCVCAGGRELTFGGGIFPGRRRRSKFSASGGGLPHISQKILLRVENSIMNIDDNITGNIIRKVVNLYEENCWTRNEALVKTSNNNRIFKNSPVSHIVFEKIFF